MNKSEIIGNYMNWCREYPGISQPIHFAIFTYLVLHVDSEMSGSVSRGVCMDTLGIFDRITWRKKLDDLHKWGWIKELSIVSSSGRKVNYKLSKIYVENFDNSLQKSVEKIDSSKKVSKKRVENFDTRKKVSVENFDSSIQKSVEKIDSSKNESVENFDSFQRQTPDLQDIGDNVDNFPSCARTHVIITTNTKELSINNKNNNNSAREQKAGIGPMQNVFLSDQLIRRAKEVCKEHYEQCIEIVGDWKESKREETGELISTGDYQRVVGWALAESIKRKENQLNKNLEKNAIKNNTNSNNQRDPRAKFPELWANNENGICEIYEAAWSCNYNAGYGDIPDDVVFRFRPDPRIHGKTLGKDDFRRIRAEINNRYRSGERKEGEMASDEARGVR